MMDPIKFEQNDERFKELVLYISQKCNSDLKFTNLKLNKLLFLADFWAYGMFGEPITGFEYKKLEKGPAPKRLPEIRKVMVEQRELALQPLPGQPWHKPVNLRSPNLRVFSGPQMSLIDEILVACREIDGEALSDISHRMPCWILPKLNETIPYEMVFLSDEEPTSADIERGKAIAAELSLLEHQQQPA
jgi:hypothetical protein